MPSLRNVLSPREFRRRQLPAIAARCEIAFAFDLGEVARPASEFPAFKGDFRADEKRPAAFTVGTGQDLQDLAIRLFVPR